MRLHRLAVVVMLSVFAAASAQAFEKIDWQSKALTVGRASLTSESYRVVQNLGTPNYSPEFRMPIELVYDSSERRVGIFGYAWRCPQLESRILPKGKDKAEWSAPWGEKILFQRKQEITKDTIDFFKQEMKGRGFFAAFSDWEADGKEGDWTIAGKRKKEGWKFFYRGSLLTRIVSPGNRSLFFAYQKGRLTAVTQNDSKLLELDYDKTGVAVGLKLNGVGYCLKYADTPVALLPAFPADTFKQLEQQMLASWQRGTIEPVTFTYDAVGFLNSIAQGENIEQLEIQHESEAERRGYLEQAAEFRKERKTAELRRLAGSRKNIAGRILKDRQFSYSYRPAYSENTTVAIRNKAGKQATYHYSETRGILTVTDFSGLTTTSYYFRRYDVAYNGKLRQVCDARDRVAVNFRYDKSTGNLTRLRDRADNDTYFTYDRNGRLTYVTRQGADESQRSPLLEIGYDSAGNPAAVSRLDADGKAAVTTRLSYNATRDVTFVSNGQTATTIAYNASGLPTQVTDTFQQTTTYRYDAFNRVVSVTAPNGTHIAYAYDDSGLVVGIEHFANSSRTEPLASLKIAYGPEGRPVSFTDNQGRVRALEHDELGRVVKDVIRLAAGAADAPDSESTPEFTTAYSYDVLGQLRRVLDRNGHPISFDWNKFGKIDSRVTAAGQYTDYQYDDFGLLTSVVSRFRKKDSIDREFRYTYDDFDRVTCIDYGNGQKKHFQYDSWGKLLKSGTEDGQVRKFVDFTYDHFGRITRKIEKTVENDQPKNQLVYQFAYNPWGQRVSRSVGVDDGSAAKTAPRITRWDYDRWGRLVKINDGDSSVAYLYNANNRLVKSTINHVDVYYTYTGLGQLETKSLGAPFDKGTAIATLKYVYATDGNISTREVNGVKQSYKYDLLGQLTSVRRTADSARPRSAGSLEQGDIAEQYTYDPAGNILSKTVNDGSAVRRTDFTYDKANQLVGSVADGKTTSYQYDAAGRLIRETFGGAAGGSTSVATVSPESTLRRTEYNYGWLDKVMNITEGDKIINSFSYHVDGQLAERRYKDFDASGAAATEAVERFVWDGLALISRSGTDYVNEPYVTGGNPVIAGGKVLFNDMLGSTLGKYDGEGFIDNRMTAFGETLSGSEGSAPAEALRFFTGKPEVEGLGYAFLFRSYRPELGKWQTSDPLGYPDGWNNLAYVNNWVTGCVDWLGGVTISGFWDAWGHYTTGSGEAATISYSVILPATGTSDYSDIMNGINVQLSNVNKNSSSGGLSGNSSFLWFQGLTLGRTTVNVSWDFNWSASAWSYDAGAGKYMRTVSASSMPILLSATDYWDFEAQEGDPWYMNLLEETIPGFIADYGGFLPGTPYSLSGSGYSSFSFSATQYE